jgi:hypothetical protein
MPRVFFSSATPPGMTHEGLYDRRAAERLLGACVFPHEYPAWKAPPMSSKFPINTLSMLTNYLSNGGVSLYLNLKSVPVAHGIYFDIYIGFGPIGPTNGPIGSLRVFPPDTGRIHVVTRVDDRLMTPIFSLFSVPTSSVTCFLGYPGDIPFDGTHIGLDAIELSTSDVRIPDPAPRGPIRIPIAGAGPVGPFAERSPIPSFAGLPEAELRGRRW